ncbi:MAG: Formamidopyrimidine-DNA glycosylase [Candidatus Tokpelaia hoelldobleri]|uniref:Formamidopyrimidine-DNA glycosylase n=1 Tax=Candidatus Tokpelaia hoelldobleri TaxID=1902579 RepID=A0A1U9JWM6_9HYPH|nr:MAG: Formamidopyrimidine-DNA glycosylase [Candidatus Tokpelaia hoelldoblerii]
MPELPEVETVRRGLEPVLEGARIVRAETRRENLRFPLPDNLHGKISGRHILSLGRRAKYLLITLDDGQTLVSHLGMSGSWRIEQVTGEHAANSKHDHVILRVAQQSGIFDIIYNDPRRFGFLLLCASDELADHPLLAKLGIEPTGNALSGDFLSGIFANKAAPLKAALLDQHNIAGLGNIYVCEALWRAQLSPARKARTLFETGRAEALATAIRDVIAEAIAAGGSTLKDYRHADGSPGYFQHKFLVYGREGEACLRCGAPVERIIQSGRSTFYCAACQL